MEEAELTEIPEAEVMEEREEWMNVHTWRDTMRWRTKLVSINKQRGASSQFGLRSLKFGQISINKHTEYIHMNKTESAFLWYLHWDDYITQFMFVSSLQIPVYLMFTDCADWSCATMLALRRSGPPDCGRRRRGGAERVWGSLPSSFVHAERGLRGGTGRWNHTAQSVGSLQAQSSSRLWSEAADILDAAHNLHFLQPWKVHNRFIFLVLT